MNRQEIFNLFLTLSQSTGLYGRLLNDILSMPEGDQDEYWEQMESIGFRSSLDVVLFVEEGRLPE